MERCAILVSVLVLAWTPLGQSAGGEQVPDFCQLFPGGGPGPTCTAYIPQFFYNSTSKQCEEFIYGGCGGNKNRFNSKKKCTETCSPHPTLFRELAQPSFAAADDCASPRSQRRMENACNQPADPGPCMGYFPMYFFNATSWQCELFIYGGCGGNLNKFKSLMDCRMYCRAVPALNSTEVCNLPPETGSCKAAFQGLYYNPQSQRCEPFIYGGCEGNKNRFKSNEHCMRTCHPEGSDVILPLVASARRLTRNLACDLEPETGPCRAHIPRFFYNHTSHQCEKFIYGGCGGNDNSFVSKRECNLNCKHKPEQPTEAPKTDATEICRLPPQAGLCEAYFPRYYYNHEKGKCEEFVYGGCGGNQNNFVDEEECLEKCKKD